MAPEILHQPSYSKAVDIWSCAIIMYILYTGSHPIFTEGMKNEQFKQKLKTCCFPKLPNALADNFIRNLSKIQYTQRYSVNEALRHPWITRNQEDQIPLSVSESIQGFNTSHLIADTFKFLCLMGRFCENRNVEIEEYQNKLCKFTEKHEESRIRSPSYKKTRRKTNDTLSKLKQLIINKEKDKTAEIKQNQYLDLQSPVLIKHQKLFLRLFDKNKVESPAETLVVEECFKAQDDEAKESIKEMTEKQSKQDQEQVYSPVLIGCNSFSSSRNNGITHYDVDLPLIKLNPDKKQREKGGLRKLNSLREEMIGKHEQNYNYFKNLGMKNSQEKSRDAVGSSKSKRVSYKFDSINIQYPYKTSGKKPQTAERGKASSKTKQTGAKPMTFGLKSSTHS